MKLFSLENKIGDLTVIEALFHFLILSFLQKIAEVIWMLFVIMLKK